MKTRKIQMTAKEVDDLIALFRNQPTEPVGHHLTDDQFIRYAMEDVSGEELQGIDAHLGSCLSCSARMEHLLENMEVWNGPEGKKRLDALEKRCLITQDTDTESEASSIPLGLQALLARFAEKKCSFTSLVYEIMQGGYLTQMDIPDEVIALIAQVLQSHSDEGILEEVITAEKEEQFLLGKHLANLLGISSPEEVFIRFSEVFGCTKWEVNPEESGFLAVNQECRFRDVFRELGAVRPCDICCLNLMEGILQAIAPSRHFGVEMTLWTGDKCEVKVLQKVA